MEKRYEEKYEMRYEKRYGKRCGKTQDMRDGKRFVCVTH